MVKEYSSVEDFYNGKNIFITGATGFLGTSLVEKLLRSFPQINRMYLLIRNKRNVTPEERFEKYFNRKVFQKMKTINPNFASKLTLINGDILAEKNLGLSEPDIQELRNNVEIVFHSAALVTFNWSLKKTLLVNLKGTNDVLNVFKGSKNVQSFVYVSTFYSNSHPERYESLEKMYPPLGNVQSILSMLYELDEEDLKAKLSPMLVKTINYYLFSKNLAENLIDSHRSLFPMGIFRPGIIVASYNEPVPYWIQGKSMHDSILKEIGKGYVGKFPTKTPSTCVPVDMTTNILIAIAYDVHKNRDKTNIYNFGCASNPLNIEQKFAYYAEGIDKLNLFISKIWYNFWLPILTIFNRSSKDVIDRYKFTFIKKLADDNSGKELVAEFNNARRLWDDLSENDRRLLFWALDDIDWKSFYGNMARGRIEDKA